QRALAGDPVVLKAYFNKLLNLIKFYKLLHANMYNMKKKVFMMGVAMYCKIICRKNHSSSTLTEDSSSEWVTVIETVSGDGPVLHPMIINKGKVHYMG
ncbi:hypothetical protein C7212DRAFT_191164, partial [Tuber magnatum]